MRKKRVNTTKNFTTYKNKYILKTLSKQVTHTHAHTYIHIQPLTMPEPINSTAFSSLSSASLLSTSLSSSSEMEYDYSTAIRVIVSIIVVLSMVFSASGFTNIMIKVFHLRNPIPKFQKWWQVNAGRDLLVDQFSWSSLVLTACIGGANDTNVHWTAGLRGVVVGAKKFVLDWFETGNSGSTHDEIKSIFFIISIASIVLKVFCCCCLKKGKLSEFILFVVFFVQSICSVMGIILLPLIFHCLGKMDSHSVMDYFSIFFTIVLFVSSIGSFDGNMIYGIVSSFVIIFLPASLCLTAGVGKTGYKRILTLAIIYQIILAGLSAASLFITFYHKAVDKNDRWKKSLIASMAIRGASFFFGFLFLLIIRFDIKKATCGFCIFLWLLWVIPPFFGVIPLVFGAIPLIGMDKEETKLEKIKNKVKSKFGKGDKGDKEEAEEGKADDGDDKAKKDKK